MALCRDTGVPLSTLGLYLLGTLLLLGVVLSQEISSTEDRGLSSNQTAPLTMNGKGDTADGPLSDGEIKVDNNATVVTQDEEAFQDWEDELRLGRCHEELLSDLCHVYCGQEFSVKMLNVREEKWCSLEEIIRPYHEMTICLERSSNAVGCFYPNHVVQEFFLQIHSHFFRNCSEEQRPLEDAPHAVVLTLTLIPVSLIPALVYITIWRNKVHNQL